MGARSITMPPTGLCLPFASPARRLQTSRLMRGVEAPDMIYFGEIVVFGREPENRNRGRALFVSFAASFAAVSAL
jgi:hypothetical protein